MLRVFLCRNSSLFVGYIRNQFWLPFQFKRRSIQPLLTKERTLLIYHNNARRRTDYAQCTTHNAPSFSFLSFPSIIGGKCLRLRLCLRSSSVLFGRFFHNLLSPCCTRPSKKRSITGNAHLVDLWPKTEWSGDYILQQVVPLQVQKCEASPKERIPVQQLCNSKIVLVTCYCYSLTFCCWSPVPS